MNPDGTGVRNLTKELNGADGYLDWSPDGTKIAFMSERERDGSAEIYTMNSDGSNQTNLTNHGGDDEFPVYSPDGRQIAFRSNRDTVNNPTGDYEIYRMSASGGRVTQLTSNTDDADTATSWQPLP